MNGIEAYLECHYFASGFKSNFIGQSPRPSYLPSPDSVGLHNEILLKGSDFAVEVNRRENSKQLTWIGVYAPSADKDYGDRGNYSGIGAWLVNCSPLHISKLLESLIGLCDILARNGFTSEYENNLREFSNDYLPKYLIPNAVIPASLAGISYGRDQYDSSKYIQADLPIRSDISKIINSIQAHLFSKQASGPNRILYFVGKASKVNVSGVASIDAVADISKNEITLSALLSYNSEFVEKEKKYIESNLALTKKFEDEVLLVQKLQNDISAANSKNQQLIQSNLSLEDKIKNQSSDFQGLRLQSEKTQVKPSLPSSDITGLNSSIRRLSDLVGRLERYEQSRSYQDQKANFDETNASFDDKDGAGSFINLGRKKFLWIGLMVVIIALIAIGLIFYQSKQASHENLKPSPSGFNSSHNPGLTQPKGSHEADPPRAIKDHKSTPSGDSSVPKSEENQSDGTPGDYHS